MAGLVENEGVAYPGALSVALPGVDCAECPTYPSVQSLARAESNAGHPATLKAGRAYLGRSVAELQVQCESGYPIVTSVVPDPVFAGANLDLYGVLFGGSTSKVYVGTGAAWPGGTLKECSQVEVGCEHRRVVVNPATGGGLRYMYVQRASLKVNLAGHPVMVLEL